MTGFTQTVDPFTAHEPLQSEPLIQKQSIEQYFSSQVIAVFNTPHGQQLLNTLEDLYIRQPVCPAGCVEGYGYMREGENRLILKLMRIARQAKQVTG